MLIVRQILCRHVRTCWVVPEAHLQCGLPMQHQLQTAAHRSGLFLTLVFALNLAKLNSLPSDLVCRKTPFWESWKANCNSVEKRILNSVGARTHPCFTPLLILKGWDEVQSKLIVLWVFPTDKIKGFGEVNENYVQWFALFPAFFL